MTVQNRSTSSGITDIIQWVAIFVLLVAAVFLAWQVASLSEQAKRMEAVVTKQKIELDKAKRKLKSATADTAVTTSTATVQTGKAEIATPKPRSSMQADASQKRALSGQPKQQTKKYARERVSDRKRGDETSRMSRAAQTRGYAVFVGSFYNSGEAGAEQRRLLGSGYPALVIREGGSWTVAIGPFGSIEEAQRYYSVVRKSDPSGSYGVIRLGR